MFLFVTRYLGFLKHVPGLGLVFDSWLRMYSALTHPQLLNWIDEIEARTLQWPHVTASTHKYGGLQLNYRGRELGHIHSNGLLDMLLSRSQKAELLRNGRISNHHYFKNNGWISFYIKSESDKAYAIYLLHLAYRRYGGEAQL